MSQCASQRDDGSRQVAQIFGGSGGGQCVGVQQWLWPAVRRNASPHLSCRAQSVMGPGGFM